MGSAQHVLLLRKEDPAGTPCRHSSRHPTAATRCSRPRCGDAVLAHPVAHRAAAAAALPGAPVSAGLPHRRLPPPPVRCRPAGGLLRAAPAGLLLRPSTCCLSPLPLPSLCAASASVWLCARRSTLGCCSRRLAAERKGRRAGQAQQAQQAGLVTRRIRAQTPPGLLHHRLPCFHTRALPGQDAPDLSIAHRLPRTSKLLLIAVSGRVVGWAGGAGGPSSRTGAGLCPLLALPLTCLKRKKGNPPCRAPAPAVF